MGTQIKSLNRTLHFNLLIVWILAYSLPIYGQIGSQVAGDSVIKHQIRLQHDNDFFTLTDRYYTSGLYITYTHRLKNGILSENEQLSFIIAQEVYTPSDITTAIITEQDRPYVGFLGVKTAWSTVKNNHGWDASLLLGIAGNNSGAGGFQRWYHKVFVVSDPPVWVGEMDNSFHANSYLRYRKEWTLAPNPFSVTLALEPQIAFGTRDQFAQADMIAYFGRRDPLSSSMSYQRLGTTQREIFFSLRAGYRFVGYNALLEGNALGDNSIFLVRPENKIIYGSLDLQHRFEKNEYFVGYRIQSPEAPGTSSHRYVSLTYSRNF
jgi:hypothetical protein